MASKLGENDLVQLTDWQLFTNNGNFNNPLPPNRRLKRRSPYFVLEVDPNYVRDRSKSLRSRHQSAISVSTSRILSARSITYRRAPRPKPVDLDLDEECEKISVYPSAKSQAGRTSRASSQHSQLWATPAWSFSHLHRAVIGIDEQAKKDYEVGRTMNALSAWQNALVFCDELSQRTQLWPENKASLDEEIATLRDTYRRHMEEIMRKNKHLHPGTTFMVPTRKCTMCHIEQPPDQFHERFSSVCQHVERTVCNKCIYNKVKPAGATSPKTVINCPEPHCTAKFNVRQIRQILSAVNKSQSLESLNRTSKNHPVERRTEFIWCAYEECGSGQFHIKNPNVSPIVTCVLCKRQTCAIHRVQWHKGMTCTEYDDKQRQPPVVVIIKQCVACRTNLQENPGVERVICPNSRCKREYCWECLADYKPIQRNGPRHHKTTCSHYKDEPKKKESKSSACTIL